MAFVFDRRLAMPLWAMAFLAVALTAPPPATVSLIAALGIAVIAFTTLGVVPWLRASPSVVQVLSNGKRHTRSGPPSMVVGTCVRTSNEPTWEHSGGRARSHHA